MKRVLCLCDAGEVRSVAMAKVLRERGHFAVAGKFENAFEHIGWMYNDDKTFIPIEEYIDAFDRILFLQEGGEHFIGRDEWGDIDNAELRQRCIDKAIEVGL